MKPVLLGQAYASTLGAPVLSAVDPRIFSLRYFQRCMACGFCNDQCCDHGVDIDLDNANRLLALGSSFEEFVGVARAEWFSEVVTADEEFPSGRLTRTRIRDGHCVFRAPRGRGCRIHAWCLENGIDYHELKPMVSTLFPLTFERGVLLPSTELLDGSLLCGGQGETLYEGVRGELAWFFGEGLVSELDRLRDAL